MEPDSHADQGGGPALIVGAGAFGEALAELRELLQALPSRSGMAFVLARHPDPEDGGRLADLLSTCTPMRVVEAEPGTAIEPDTVYVATPGRAVSVRGAHLASRALPARGGGAGAIDRMLQSLARDYGPQAVGIVFPASDGDGRAGLRAIRRGGGLAIVRGDPDDSGHEGALEGVDADAADLVLDTRSMPRALERFARMPQEMRTRRGGTRPAAAG
jgi:two-component system CheB/CheR fusion protein